MFTCVPERFVCAPSVSMSNILFTRAHPFRRIEFDEVITKSVKCFKGKYIKHCTRHTTTDICVHLI